MNPKPPHSSTLPIRHLATCFSDVTNSYKFYWFLSILEHVRDNQSHTIPINDLLANMVAGAWYPSNYFRLLFGKQDQFNKITSALKTESGLSEDAKKSEVIRSIDSLPSISEARKKISNLRNYVPYRFLRPFFSNSLRGVQNGLHKRIIELSDESFGSKEPTIYRFTKPSFIEIHPLWFDYINRHLQILMDFCWWHLLNYLQRKNPNVPNIAAKLFEPTRRDMKNGKRFWDIALGGMSVQCIYSDKLINTNDLSLDHFLPWSFVAHDLCWNLTPTSTSVNSSKGNNLPDFDQYFTKFAKLQHEALKFVVPVAPRELIEDYVLLFRTASISDITKMRYEDFEKVLHDTVAPQIQIAQNMGFSSGWVY